MTGLANDAPIRWRWLGRIALTAVVAGGIAAVVAGGVAFVVSQSLPKEYDSQAGVIVGSLTATSTDELDAYQRLAMTYAELATSSPLLTQVIDQLGLSDNPVNLAARINVRASGQGILLIDATAASPSEASQIANTIADEIVKLGLPATVTSPTPSGASSTPSASRSLASVFQPALPPGAPTSPRISLNTLIAGLLGFVLGAGFAVVISTRRTGFEEPTG